MCPDPPAQWEYRTVQPPREPSQKEARDPQSMLDELGASGWELADTIEYVGGGTKLLVFKRPVAGVESDTAESDTAESDDEESDHEESGDD